MPNTELAHERSCILDRKPIRPGAQLGESLLLFVLFMTSVARRVLLSQMRQISVFIDRQSLNREEVESLVFPHPIVKP